MSTDPTRNGASSHVAEELHQLVGQWVVSKDGCPRWWRVYPENHDVQSLAIVAENCGVRAEITLEANGLSKLAIFESAPYTGPDLYFQVPVDGVMRALLYSTVYDPAYQDGTTEDVASLVAIAARFLLLQVKPIDALPPAVQQQELEFATAVANDDTFRTYFHQQIDAPSPEDPAAKAWAAGFRANDGGFVWFAVFYQEADAAAAAKEMTARRVRKGTLG